MLQPIIDHQTITQLEHFIAQARHIVITCHISPDGDALGSTLALCTVLRRMGKDAHVVIPDQAPRSLSFMPHYDELVVYSINENRGRVLVHDAQLIFCLDFNTLKRIDKLGALIAQSGAPKVLIDHHLNPEPIFDTVISFPGLSSTCELVYRTLWQLRLTRYINVQVAQCLYVGMMTDTGNFTYGSDYPEIYHIIAALVALGIDKEWLYNMTMNTFSQNCLRLQGYALSEKMQVFAHKGAALISLSATELAHYGYSKGDTEGLVNKPLAIPEVRWSMFLREDPECIKVSCRSQGDFSVNDLCHRYFNGGGHKNAAGGEFHGTLDEAIDLFYQILEEN